MVFIKAFVLAITLSMLWSCLANAQSPPQATTPAGAPSRDTTYIAPDGTAYITRVIPVPKTVSPEARKWIARQIPDSDAPSTSSLAERRLRTDLSRKKNGKIALEKYPARTATGSIAGVPVTIVTPLPGDTDEKHFVLINIHGGAYEFDCCSLTESIPIASLMKTEVVAVRYRLAPEHPFPAGVDDVIAVYRELLKSHPAARSASTEPLRERS